MLWRALGKSAAKVSNGAKPMKMKRTVALAVAMALAAGVPVTTASAQGPMSSIKQSSPSSDVVPVRRGGAVALGIIAGVGTAILLSEAARAEGHRRYRRSSYCGDLLYRCEDGSRWACRRYENRCY
jgi:hypothetical protein